MSGYGAGALAMAALLLLLFQALLLGLPSSGRVSVPLVAARLRPSAAADEIRLFTQTPFM